MKAAFATTEVAKPYLYARERRALLYEVYVTITGSKASILSDLGQNSRPHKAIEIHDKATLKTISHQSESLHVYTTYTKAKQCKKTQMEFFCNAVFSDLFFDAFW